MDIEEIERNLEEEIKELRSEANKLSLLLKKLRQVKARLNEEYPKEFRNE